MSKKHNEHTEAPSEEALEHPQQEKRQSIVEPLIADLKKETATIYSSEDELGAPNPPGPGHPPQPAELDQDAGSGYNPDGTDPQT